MKKFKRIVCILLVICLSIGIVPSAATKKKSANTILIEDTVKDIKAYLKKNNLKIYNHWSAHRGCSAFAPENTLPAFKVAARLGAPHIETDIRVTKDNVAICMHDEYINRTTTGKGQVQKLKYSTIKSYTIRTKVWFKGRSYKNVKVPTLKQLLNVCSYYPNLIAKLELKAVPKGQSVAKYAKVVYDTVVESGLQDQVLAVSFDYATLNAFAKQVKKGVEEGKPPILIWYVGSDKESKDKLHKDYGTNIYPITNPYYGTHANYPMVLVNNVRYAVKIAKNKKGKYVYKLDDKGWK